MAGYCGECEACKGLAAQYGSDPQLFDLYRRKLLIRGWAGRTSPIEKAYILAHAPWAQAGAERLAKARVHLSIGHQQIGLEAGAVPEDLEEQTGHFGAPTRRDSAFSVSSTSARLEVSRV